MAGRNNPRTKPKGRSAVSKKVTTKTVSRGRNANPRSSNTTVRTSGSTGSSTIRTASPSSGMSIARMGGGLGAGIAAATTPSPLGSGTRRGGERVMTGTEAAGATGGMSGPSARRTSPSAPTGSTEAPSRPSSSRERPTRPGQETSGRPQPSRPISRTPDYAKSGGAMGQGNKEPSYVGQTPKVAEKINKTQPTQAKSVAESQTKKDRGYSKRSGGFGFMAGNRRGGR